MMPFDTLSLEQTIQAVIVRIDIVLVAVWRVLRILLPALCVAGLLFLVIHIHKGGEHDAGHRGL